MCVGEASELTYQVTHVGAQQLPEPHPELQARVPLRVCLGNPSTI